MSQNQRRRRASGGTGTRRSASALSGAGAQALLLRKDHAALRSPTREELHNGPSRDSLPPKIKKMSRGDTCCSFCGVSYLVFSEVKELEDKLRQAEEEAAALRAATAAAPPPPEPPTQPPPVSCSPEELLALRERVRELERGAAVWRAELSEAVARADAAERCVESAEHDAGRHRREAKAARADADRRAGAAQERLAAERSARHEAERGAARLAEQLRHNVPALGRALRGLRQECVQAAAAMRAEAGAAAQAVARSAAARLAAGAAAAGAA
eukprot:g3775.t1